MRNVRHKHGWPLGDLGYAFNYVGSFEGANAERRPARLPNATDAYVVHATTGLADSSTEGRLAFLRRIDHYWEVRGK